MRWLDEASRKAVDKVIATHQTELAAIPGFISAEPGFALVDGAILREPAVVVFVRQKKPLDSLLAEARAPRQLGSYRVSVLQAGPERQLEANLAAFGDMASRLAESADELSYEKIEGNPIDVTLEVKAPFLCHVGPDAGWPTLKPFLEAAEETLSVAMYDLNADYIATSFIDLVRSNDLKVVLTWDDGMTAPETAIRKQLKDALGARLDGWLVRCGASRRFASAYHEKVAVRDSKAFWLSSGNWSLRSQPNIDPIGKPSQAKGMYSKGNREWHVIVEDEPLAKLYERYIRYDRDGSQAEQDAGDPGAALDMEDLPRLPDVFVPLEDLLAGAELAAPPVPVAPQSLPRTPRKVTVRPLLTPDNYLERIVEFLDSATRSIYLQFAYINWSAAAKDKRFRDLLNRLGELSYKPGLDVRIILGDSDAADKIRKLAEAGFNDHVFRVQGSIHNKGIIVDGAAVLVSSANWSGDGVLRNRDAGLIIYDAEIAAYYQSVFLDDWDNRARTRLDDGPRAILAEEGEPTPPGMARISWRDFFGS